MNYLVNPLWIYLIDVCCSIDNIIFAIITIGGVATIIGGMIYIGLLTIDGHDINDKEPKLVKSILKPCIIVLIIGTIMSCIIPSEKTMYAMFAASYITEENIETASQTVTDVVDYIFEKVDELQND